MPDPGESRGSRHPHECTAGYQQRSAAGHIATHLLRSPASRAGGASWILVTRSMRNLRRRPGVSLFSELVVRLRHHNHPIAATAAPTGGCPNGVWPGQQRYGLPSAVASQTQSASGVCAWTGSGGRHHGFDVLGAARWCPGGSRSRTRSPDCPRKWSARRRTHLGGRGLRGRVRGQGRAFTGLAGKATSAFERDMARASGAGNYPHFSRTQRDAETRLGGNAPPRPHRRPCQGRVPGTGWSRDLAGLPRAGRPAG